jgi:hypothetical protein
VVGRSRARVVGRSRAGFLARVVGRSRAGGLARMLGRSRAGSVAGVRRLRALWLVAVEGSASSGQVGKCQNLSELHCAIFDVVSNA